MAHTWCRERDEMNENVANIHCLCRPSTVRHRKIYSLMPPGMREKKGKINIPFDHRV